MKEFLIEKATSNRSTCSKCGDKIELGALRLKIKSQGFKFPTQKSECSKCAQYTLRFEIKQFQEKLDLLISREKMEANK